MLVIIYLSSTYFAYFIVIGSQRGRASSYRGGRGMQAQGGAGHSSSSAQQMNKRTRWFIALFDYDPKRMSPNPDACEEELPFSEGDTIKVFTKSYCNFPLCVL